MSKREVAITITALAVATIIFFIPKSNKSDLSTETIASTEIYTETEKPSEIDTESVITSEETTSEDADITDTYFMGEPLHYSKPYKVVEHPLSVKTGLIYFRGHVEVWYSVKEKIGYTTKQSIPGKHVADDGTIRDEDGFVCVASSYLPFGYTLMTSMGPGKVYDDWGTHKSIAIYTDWREEE